MHPLSGKHTLGAELVILCDGAGIPAADFLQERDGGHKTGACDEAGKTQGLSAGVIKPVDDPEVDGEA
ncbi:hypothetical protein D3C76_1353590 [compost metagenome]